MTPQQIRQAQVLKISEKALCRNRRGTYLCIQTQQVDGIDVYIHIYFVDYIYTVNIYIYLFVYIYMDTCLSFLKKLLYFE